MRGVAATVLVAAIVLPVAGASTERAGTIRVVSASPVTVAGFRFTPLDRVKVYAAVDMVKRSKTVTASATGTFRAVFTTLIAQDPCNVRVSAVASDGSRAVWKAPERMCPVGQSIP
jgi:hypothetical protein